LPVAIDEHYLNEVRKTLPELPGEKQKRFIAHYGLSAEDAAVLTSSREMGDFFEQTAKASDEPKLSANWIMSDLLGALNKSDMELSQSPVSAEMLGGMIKRITDNTISGKIAKQVFEAMWNGEGDADAVIEKKGLKQITDTGAIEKIIDEIIANNPEQVEQYRSGKEKVFGFFVGQVMKASKGKANPQQVNQLLKDKLK
jgi:aspartyl-tRNA(Asn)/glutamyl-tRNA(Gln) amidotransferase subunit B